MSANTQKNESKKKEHVYLILAEKLKMDHILSWLETELFLIGSCFECLFTRWFAVAVEAVGLGVGWGGTTGSSRALGIELEKLYTRPCSLHFLRPGLQQSSWHCQMLLLPWTEPFHCDFFYHQSTGIYWTVGQHKLFF